MRRLNVTIIAAVLGLISTRIAAQDGNLEDQSSGNYNTTTSSIDDKVLQDYNYVEHVFDGNDIYGIRNKFWSDVEPIRWLLDIPNGMDNGTNIRVLETRKDGVAYPEAFTFKDDLYVAVHNPIQSSPNAFCFDYVNAKGYTIARYWINKENPALFDIDFKFLDFYLPKEYEKYTEFANLPRDSSFGERNIWIYGGSDSGFHYGNDIPTDQGESFRAPSDGSLIIGYDESAGYFALLNFYRKTYEKINGARGSINRYFQMNAFHANEFSERIIERFKDSGVRKDFIDMITEWPSEQIFRYLSKNNFYSIHSGISVPVEQGEEVFKTGWTGESNGPHIHIEFILHTAPGSSSYYRNRDRLNLLKKPDDKSDKFYADPIKFQDMYLKKQIKSPEEIAPLIQKARNIMDYMQ